MTAHQGGRTKYSQGGHELDHCEGEFWFVDHNVPTCSVRYHLDENVYSMTNH